GYERPVLPAVGEVAFVVLVGRGADHGDLAVEDVLHPGVDGLDVGQIGGLRAVVRVQLEVCPERSGDVLRSGELPARVADPVLGRGPGALDVRLDVVAGRVGERRLAP